MIATGGASRAAGALAALVAWLGLAAAPTADVPGRAAPFRSADGDFSHANHVAVEWIRQDARGGFVAPETKRDCRGCHAFAAGADGREVSLDPRSKCAACHYADPATGAASLDVSAAPVGAWSRYAAESLRRPDPVAGAFTHAAHDGVDCRECHAGELVRAESGQDFVGDAMPIPRGQGSCVRCHDPRGPTPDARAVRPDAGARFLAALDRSPRAAHADRFRHDEHLAKPEGARGPADCAPCHDMSRSTATGLADGEYVPSACDACHRGAGESTPVSFDKKRSARPSAAALCFDHADHLSPTALLSPTLSVDGCASCHTYDASAGTYALRPDFGNYAACAECHARAAAATPAPVRPPPASADHGRWGGVEGFGKCDLCHAVDATGASPHAMRANRRRATKTRPILGAFRVTTHVHPHVTTADGAPVHGRCAECHRAAVPELPSRIVEARFSHATHVPKDPAAAEASCKKCHGDPVAKASSSDEIVRTYDPRACAECHRGASPTAETRPAAAGARVPPVEFDHVRHLSARHPDRSGADATMRCSDCHDAAGGEDPGFGYTVGVKPGAVSCTDCHRHDDARKAITGGKDAAYVAACVRCHDRGVPAPGAVVMTTHATIVGLLSKKGQSHSACADRTCSECHKAAPTDFVAATFVRANGKGRSPHGASGGAARYPEGVSCASCHWRDWASLPSGTLSPDLKGKKPAEVRARDGAALERFPGGGR